MKFRFIESHQAQFSVRRMCQVLGVSSSGFYAWLKRTVSQRERNNEVLLQRIREIFERSRQRYGSPRIHAELWAAGWRIGRKRVASLMRLHGIRARPQTRLREAQAVAYIWLSVSEPTAAGLHSSARQPEVACRYRANPEPVKDGCTWRWY